MPKQAEAVAAIANLKTALDHNDQASIEKQLAILEQIGLSKSVEHPSVILTRLFDEILGTVSLDTTHSYILLRLLKVMHMYAELSFSHQQHQQETFGGYLFNREQIEKWRERLNVIKDGIRKDTYNEVLLFEFDCISNCINLFDKKILSFNEIKEFLVSIANIFCNPGSFDVGPAVILIDKLRTQYCGGYKWYASVLTLRDICSKMLNGPVQNIQELFKYLKSANKAGTDDIPIKSWQFHCCILDTLTTFVLNSQDLPTRKLAFELLEKHGSNFKAHSIDEINEETSKVTLEYITSLFRIYESTKGREDEETSVRVSLLLGEIDCNLRALQEPLQKGKDKSLKYIELLQRWFGEMERRLRPQKQTAPQAAAAATEPAEQQPIYQLNVTTLQNVSTCETDRRRDVEIKASISSFKCNPDIDPELLTRIMKLKTEEASVLMKERNVNITAVQSPDKTLIFKGKGRVVISATAVETVVEPVSRKHLDKKEEGGKKHHHRSVITQESISPQSEQAPYLGTSPHSLFKPPRKTSASSPTTVCSVDQPTDDKLADMKAVAQSQREVNSPPLL